MSILISDKFNSWEKKCNYRFEKLLINEKEINNIFISLYGLNNELSSDVSEKDITLKRADLYREIKSLISYAVGCIFGRYSIDYEGLCYAGGDWDPCLYKTIIPITTAFLPISSYDCFKDNFIVRFIDFIRIIYGDSTLEENLSFISEVLGYNLSPIKSIEKFLNSDFFTDHCIIYHKRPIYWFINSGRRNAFRALMYIHRYNTDTLMELYENFIIPCCNNYKMKINNIDNMILSTSSNDKISLRREKEILFLKYEELQIFSKKCKKLAEMHIKLELDDGITANYAKLSEILQKI